MHISKMVLKKHSPALERSFSLEKEIKNIAPFFRASPLFFNIIPDKLLSEIIGFCRRNVLEIEYPNSDYNQVIYHCCPKCLKAHIIKKAKEEKISLNKIENMLDKVINCEAGHSGYYMDKDNIIKI